MGLEFNAGNVGSAAWKLLNTGLGAAGTAMSATALGSKTSEEKVREIVRQETGCGCGNGHGVCGGYCGGLRGFNETVVISQPCSENTAVNRFELGQTQEIARLQAKEYSDMSDLKLFEDYTTRMAAEKDRVNGRFETIFTELVASRERQQAEICRLDKEVALNKQANEFQFAAANREFSAINSRLDAITKEVIPLSAICPQPMAGCVPVGFQGQIVPTTPTGETNTVIAARTAAAKQ